MTTDTKYSTTTRCIIGIIAVISWLLSVPIAGRFYAAGWDEFAPSAWPRFTALQMVALFALWRGFTFVAEDKDGTPTDSFLIASVFRPWTTLGLLWLALAYYRWVFA